MRPICRRSPCGRYVGDFHANDNKKERLWNQKGADTGSFLFGRMAASYNYSPALTACGVFS